MPIYIIILSLIVIFPLGIYYIVLKTEDKLRNIKKVATNLKLVGFLGMLVGVIYFLANYSVYVSLIDSHMNLDMYSFNFIYIYIYIIMVVVSSFIGYLYLNKICERFMIYTEFINITHIKDIKLICDETLESLEEVKNNIDKLVKLGYLVNIKVSNDNIISTKTVDKNKLVKCKTCGNVEVLHTDKIRCTFCMRKLTRKDHM